MRTRYFYKADGSRQKVTLKEYNRRKKIQAKAYRRQGKEVWEDRRGRQIGVSRERLARLERKRESARKAKDLGWDLIRGIKVAAQEGKLAALKAREYPGPSMTIRSSVDEGVFHARLLDAARIAVRQDGRSGFLSVTARVESDIFSPEDPTGEEANTSSVQLYAISDQKIMRVDKATTGQALGRLVRGVAGLERKYAPKSDPTREVVAGAVVSGPTPEDQNGPRYADPGYYAEFTSVIIIRSVTK